MKRPLGVTILGIIAIIFGALGAIVGLFGLLGATAGSAAITAAGAYGTTAAVDTGQLAVASIVALVLGVLEVIFGIGFLRLAGWAWMLGIIAEVLGLVYAIYSIVTGTSIASEALSIVIGLVILWYLFRPNVRQAFGR